jgi:hypothetical protein
MSLNLTKVHEYAREADSGRMVLVKSDPYVRFVARESFPVICQAGKWYTDGGDRLAADDVPRAVWAQARNMSKESRKKCGLILPEETEVVIPPPPSEGAPSVAGQNSTAPTDEDILVILHSLDPENDHHWTEKGLPSLEEVHRQIGRYVRRDKLNAIAPDLTRENAAALRSEGLEDEVVDDG